MSSKSEKQRRWVNHQFGDITRGKSFKLAEKKKILKRLWRESRNRIYNT